MIEIDNSNKYTVKCNVLFPKHIIFYQAGIEIGSLDIVVDFEKLPEDLHGSAANYLLHNPIILYTPTHEHIEKVSQVVEPIKKPWWKFWG